MLHSCLAHLSRAAVLAIAFVLYGLSAQAQTHTVSEANSVLLTAEPSASGIRLKWNAFEEVAQYEIYKKERSEPSFDPAPWVTLTVSGTPPEYYDDVAAVAGVLYEYKVVRTAEAGVGYGYVCTGYEVPLAAQLRDPHSMGRILLLVESDLATELIPELAQLRQDLKADGWVVEQVEVASTLSVADVKAEVVDVYDGGASGLRAVYIIGQVAVPYSGLVSQDGHFAIWGGHVGAWPCDGYYGDMDGVWTTDQVDTDDLASDPDLSFDFSSGVW
jgi:hypothetical protein